MSGNSKYWLGIILITIGLSTLLTRKHNQTFDKTLDVGNSISLNVTTSSGNIDIQKSDSNKLKIDTEVKVRSFIPFEARRITNRIKRNPPVEQNGDSIVIGDMSNYRFGPSLLRSISIDYDIETPYETELTLRSSSGNQTVEDIAGPISAKVSSGNIDIESIDGDIGADLSSGNLSIEDINGDLNIKLSSGEVKLSNIIGRIVSEQSSGNATLKDVSKEINIKTSSGNIKLDSDLPQNTDWTLKSSSGNIILDIPDDEDFNIDASVTSGDIDLGNLEFVGEESAKKAIGTIGTNSSNRLNINTTSGNIRFN